MKHQDKQGASVLIAKSKELTVAINKCDKDFDVSRTF
jgi:predicted GTPase